MTLTRQKLCFEYIELQRLNLLEVDACGQYRVMTAETCNVLCSFCD